MLEGSIAFTLSGATEFKKMGFGSLTIPENLNTYINCRNIGTYCNEY